MAANSKSFSQAVKSVIRTKSFAPKKPKRQLPNRPSLASYRQVFRSEPASLIIKQILTITTMHLCPICFKYSQWTIRKFEKVHLNCICQLLSNPRVKRKRLGRSRFMTIYQLLYCPCSKLEPTNIKRAKKCQQHSCTTKKLAAYSEIANKGLQRRLLQ